MIFDIETGPLPLDYLLQIHGDYEHVPFDPESVKHGNTKDEEKRAAKTEECRIKHLKEQTERADKHREDLVGEGALSPLSGQVLAIGMVSHDDQNASGLIIGETEQTEEAILARFWKGYEQLTKANFYLVGFNIHGFDLPFLVQRSFIKGVDVPRGLLVRGKWWNESFIDLKEVWGCGNKYSKGDLDTLCRMMGIGRKSGDGADFYKLWELSRPAAIAYLRQDLILTRDLADRLGLFK